MTTKIDQVEWRKKRSHHLRDRGDYMPYWMPCSKRPGRPRAWRALAVLAAVGVSLSLCGPAGASPKPAPQASAASARARIVADWEAFFSGKTSASRKIALVQDGKSFAQVIKAQAGSAMAKSVAATVSKVTRTSVSTAKVRYSLTMGGKPALANQQGKAVLVEGTWKVGVQSFCQLLALEQVKVRVCSASAAG